MDKKWWLRPVLIRQYFPWSFWAAAQPDSGHEWRYLRHRSELTQLYQLVEQYYHAFVEQLVRQGKFLPGCAHREFDAYFRCGRLEYGFLRYSLHRQYRHSLYRRLLDT